MGSVAGEALRRFSFESSKVPAQLSGQGFWVTSQDIILITRPQVARRRPMVVRMQAMLPSAIFLPSLQQKQ
ncbi:hypothetical protein B6S44_07325 [Bosea sp. Tri-44]|nr:hypothetical protein B6S44_07325 [Bosea sp. Tri-44]